MQVDRDCPNFRETNMLPRYRTFLKLGKQQRLKLTELFESGKPKSPLPEVFQCTVKLFDGLLQHLRRWLCNPWKFPLGVWQRIKLIHLRRKLQIRRQDILLHNRTSINQALPTVEPILDLSQCVIVDTPRNLHPPKQSVLLSGVRIDSVAVVHG